MLALGGQRRGPEPLGRFGLTDRRERELGVGVKQHDGVHLLQCHLLRLGRIDRNLATLFGGVGHWLDVTNLIETSGSVLGHQHSPWVASKDTCRLLHRGVQPIVAGDSHAATKAGIGERALACTRRATQHQTNSVTRDQCTVHRNESLVMNVHRGEGRLDKQPNGIVDG